MTKLGYLFFFFLTGKYKWSAQWICVNWDRLFIASKTIPLVGIYLLQRGGWKNTKKIPRMSSTPNHWALLSKYVLNLSNCRDIGIWHPTNSIRNERIASGVATSINRYLRWRHWSVLCLCTSHIHYFIKSTFGVYHITSLALVSPLLASSSPSIGVSQGVEKSPLEGEKRYKKLGEIQVFEKNGTEWRRRRQASEISFNTSVTLEKGSVHLLSL